MNMADLNAQGSEVKRPEQPIGSSLLTAAALKGQTLLVVEDEETVREVEALVLRSGGYRVLEAGCVAEALQVAAATTPIHLLLTDHSLPDGNGLDLARRFRQLHPQAAILLVSGSVTELGGNADGLDRFATMQKPFQFGELLELIRALLAHATPLAQSSDIVARPNCGRDAATVG
jgi:DNA-binding response OmpR family regulator